MTYGGLRRLWELMRDARRYYKLMHPHAVMPCDVNITDKERFFLECIDRQDDYYKLGISRFQVEYGLRDDDNFAVRLATRTLQWRIIKDAPDAMRTAWPAQGVDVAPLVQWDRGAWFSWTLQLIFQQSIY